MKDDEERLKKKGIERVGPFYVPRKLTLEEREQKRKENAAKKLAEMVKVEEILKEKNYDKGSKWIARFACKYMGLRFAKLYLWRFQMFNSALVELYGLALYLLLMPLFVDVLFVSCGPWKWIIGVLFAAPISFLSKFVINKKWLFKEVINDGCNKKSVSNRRSRL